MNNTDLLALTMFALFALSSCSKDNEDPKKEDVLIKNSWLLTNVKTKTTGKDISDHYIAKDYDETLIFKKEGKMYWISRYKADIDTDTASWEIINNNRIIMHLKDSDGDDAPIDSPILKLDGSIFEIEVDSTDGFDDEPENAIFTFKPKI